MEQCGEIPKKTGPEALARILSTRPGWSYTENSATVQGPGREITFTDDEDLENLIFHVLLVEMGPTLFDSNFDTMELVSIIHDTVKKYFGK
jgi:hypothetical protein